MKRLGNGAKTSGWAVWSGARLSIQKKKLIQCPDSHNLAMNPIKLSGRMHKNCLTVFSHRCLPIIMISLLSLGLTFAAGEKGFMPFDQSIVFDGGYRILSGQIPYKDFVIPIGPVVFWIQAVFFKLLGINYFSYIFGAALFNLLATICSVVVLQLLFPSRRILSYAAGLLTAIWFYPPFGTLYYDQTAFFFSLAAMTVLLSALVIERHFPVTDSLLLFVAGGFVFLSFMSKQNAGLFMFPMYFLLLGAAHGPNWRRVLNVSLIFLAGFIASSAIFLAWLLLKSRLDIFVQTFFEIPAGLGVDRLHRNTSALLRILFLGAGPTSNRFVLTASFIIGWIALFTSVRNYDKIRHSWKRTVLPCFLCLYCVFFQRLFIYTTKNQPENCFPFVGIILACGLGLMLDSIDSALLGSDIFARHTVRIHGYIKRLLVIAVGK